MKTWEIVLQACKDAEIQRAVWKRNNPKRFFTGMLTRLNTSGIVDTWQTLFAALNETINGDNYGQHY